MMRLNLTLAFLLVPTLLAGQASSPGRTSVAITVPDLKLRESIVADDSTMGRMAGSHGDDAAARYIAAEYQRLGLVPAGEHGTWFQEVPLVSRAYDTTSTLTVDGGAVVNLKDVVLLWPAAALPSGKARAIEGAQVVFGGVDGDSARQIGAAEAAGKFVILAAPRGPDGRPGYRTRRHPVPSALLGAAAIAFATLDLTPSAVIEQWRQGSVSFPAEHPATTAVPSYVVLSKAAAMALLGRPVDGAAPGTIGRVVHGHLGFEEGPLEIPARNVVALLPGSDPTLKGEVVSLSAHHDHVGFNHAPVDRDSMHAYMREYEVLRQASPTRQVDPARAAAIVVNVDSLRRHGPAHPDSIFNGADDDASGIAAQLEIAEALAEAPRRPRRSILFLSHTGEELGLLGSRWYSDHPTVPIDSFVAEIDMDMVGRGARRDLAEGGPDYLELIGSRRQSTQFGDLIDSVNRQRSTPFRINYAYDAPGHPEQDWCRADHYSYARLGVPVAAFSTSYHGDYHQVTDQPEYIDYPHLAAIASFIRDLVVASGNRPRRFRLDKPKPDPEAACTQ